MRYIALLVLLAGCKQVFDLEGYTPSPDDKPRELPFSDRVVGTTRAGTIAVATRDGFGFPDAETDYRLYLNGHLFAEGSLETTDWNAAISFDDVSHSYTFSLVTERCVVDDNGARCERVAPPP